MPKPEKVQVKVRIPEKDWEKILTYCRAADPNEIIGMAHAKILDGAIVVHDPFILKQEVTSGTCEMEPKSLVEFIGKHDRIADVKVVWHSHVRMGAFFSSCDRDTSDTLSMLGKMMQAGASWFVSIVANIRGEYECKVDMYKPFPAVLDGEIVTICPKNDEIEKEVKALVSSRSYSGGGYSGGPYHHGRGHGGEGVTIIGGGKEKGKDKDKPYSENDVFSEIDMFGGGD